MIVQCPYCYSENVTNLSADGNDFICNDCGEDFQVDIDSELNESGDANFLDIPPEIALKIAKQLREQNNKNDVEKD
jgi:transposase-like protein